MLNLNEHSRIILDSISPSGNRITTFLIKIPKCLQAELNTHREMGAKSSVSSRAVPIEAMIERVLNDTYYPVWTGKQAGMAGATLTQEQIDLEHKAWAQELEYIVSRVKERCDRGIHKQDANRLLEPFMYVEVLVTATEYDNFFLLRDHEAAHPGLRVVAHSMKFQYEQSIPQKLNYGTGTYHLVTS